LLLHASGGDEQDLVNLGRGLADEANLLSPRWPLSGSDTLHLDPDLPPALPNQVALADFVAAAAMAHGFDRRLVVAVAVSGGASLAVGLLLGRPGMLRGAVLFQPTEQQPPAILPNLSGVPVFIGAGRQDPHSTPAQTLRLAEMLLDAGAAVTVSWHDGDQEVAQPSFRSARTWLRLTGLITQP
jgi:predicted esterase